jgi:m7GpppX diphosphatase
VWGEQAPAPPVDQVNWLAIATEPGLQSLRDLRGRHLPMLRRMLRQCRKRIREETGVAEEEVMAYVHYPPSVYQLHVHFAYPYAQYNHRDVFRIHSLATVINNLEIDPDYYAKAHLQVSLGRNSALHQICASEPAPAEWQAQRRKSI